MKTEGPLQDRAFSLARWAAIATLLAIGAVSAATPFLRGSYWHHWFTFPGVLATAQVPLLVVVAGVALFYGLYRRKERWPFPIALGLFALSYAGLGISLFPDIVPQRLTVWQAAAPANSQAFMLVGAVVLIPVILTYTGYAYWIFRGKTGEAGYHS